MTDAIFATKRIITSISKTTHPTGQQPPQHHSRGYYPCLTYPLSVILLPNKHKQTKLTINIDRTTAPPQLELAPPLAPPTGDVTPLGVQSMEGLRVFTERQSGSGCEAGGARAEATVPREPAAGWEAVLTNDFRTELGFSGLFECFGVICDLKRAWDDADVDIGT